MAIDVIQGPDNDCARCGRALLLTASVPSGMVNGRGEPVGGHATVPLCGHCDQDGPNAGPLITFLTVHEQITDDLAGQFAGYVSTWLAGLKAPVVDESAWDADYQAWIRGDFDD